MNNLSVVLLHKHPEYMLECCQLINEEWPRSETARLLSLQSSSDKLPTCLILLDANKKVIGHCKLTPIPSIPDSCFVETVVISKKLRGKKLGSYLMSAAEKYCIENLKLRMVHLSTKGQEIFYEKLGYQVCPPVTIYGGFNKSNLATNCSVKDDKMIKCKPQPARAKETINISTPPPPPFISNTQNNATKQSKTFMVKYIVNNQQKDT